MYSTMQLHGSSFISFDTNQHRQESRGKTSLLAVGVKLACFQQVFNMGFSQRQFFGYSNISPTYLKFLSMFFNNFLIGCHIGE
jgi:hypothetical protein